MKTKTKKTVTVYKDIRTHGVDYVVYENGKYVGIYLGDDEYIKSLEDRNDVQWVTTKWID